MEYSLHKTLQKDDKTRLTGDEKCNRRHRPKASAECPGKIKVLLAGKVLSLRKRRSSSERIPEFHKAVSISVTTQVTKQSGSNGQVLKP